MDAVVIGGGLVGPMCALFLAKRGYTVRVYEKRSGLYCNYSISSSTAPIILDPRTAKVVGGRTINLVLSNRGRRALKEVGLEDDVLGNAIFMKGRLIHDISGNQSSHLYDDHNKQCVYSIQRDYLNKRLLNALEEHPNVSLYFNYKLTELDNKKGKLKFLNLKNDHICEVTSNFLVGADGAFSKVRQGIQNLPTFNFSQTYIDHGYIEMSIPSNLGCTMVPNHLHIWPRGKFLMVAMPNSDESWTASLFMPFSKFQELDGEEKILNFFYKGFPDSVEILGEDQIVKSILSKVPSTLVSVKCNKFHTGDNVVLIGDAAHAMVPFYGQGMNSGFEDCLILNSILENCNDDLNIALRQFSELRVKNGNLICDLSLEHYAEMSDLVTRPTYIMRKTLDDFLFGMFPNVWIPLYNSISFSAMGYQDCVKNRQWQNKIILSINGVVALAIAVILWNIIS